LTKQIEHVLKKWEKKYGYLRLSHKELELYSAVKNKRFTLEVLGEEHYDRKIDNRRRIWISHAAFRGLKEGDILILGQDEKGKFFVKKKDHGEIESESL
jgi:hypothetical protein